MSSHILTSAGFIGRNHSGSTFHLFVVYVALSPIWPLCVLLDIYRKGTLVSHIPFELFLVTTLAAFDAYLFPRMVADNTEFQNGTFSRVYFAVEIVALSITMVILGGYAFVLLGITLHSHLCLGRPEVWMAAVRDWRWFDSPTPAGDIDIDNTNGSSLGHKVFLLLVGQSRGLGIKSGFYRPLNQFISNHTVFRRVIGVEPIWLALIRGTIGLTFLVALVAYGAIQCLQLPLAEDANNLPVRPIERGLWDRTPPFTSLENVTVASTLYRIGATWNLNVLPAQPIAEAVYANGSSRVCTPSYVNQTQLQAWYYDCMRPGDLPDPFSENSESWAGGQSWLDSTQTSITVTMDWSVILGLEIDPSSIVALVGLDTVNESPWDPKEAPSILKFQHPSYLQLHMGQNLQAFVETYSITKRRLNFLDVFGISRNLQVQTYHPISSIIPLQSSTPSNNNLSSVTFYPSFGLQGQHLLEEYRESTVVAGLGATGGLYAILDLIFGILFGRPLVAIISGSKYISPFGLFVTVFGASTMRHKVKKRYPELESTDRAQRSVSTSDFLHDFVLDFGPGVSQPSMFSYNPEASESVENYAYGPVRNPSSAPYLAPRQDGHNEYGRDIELTPTESIRQRQQSRAVEPSGIAAGNLAIWANEYSMERDFDPTELHYGGAVSSTSSRYR
ncbi:hypothetical protein FRB96_005642 [Tulasnella sp. 330]|nr:hypothetical protein FRB96_005642 [Tulasnella sp. 330]